MYRAATYSLRDYRGEYSAARNTDDEYSALRATVNEETRIYGDPRKLLDKLRESIEIHILGHHHANDVWLAGRETYLIGLSRVTFFNSFMFVVDY